MAIFTAYITLLKNAEGGYQNLPQDTGNYNSKGELVGTNHGISAKTYENWIGRPPSVADMKNITLNLALEIYKAWYWNKIGAAYISNQSIANLIVDHAVNAGIGAAGKLAQSVLNQYFNYNLVEDGIIGNQTRTALNSVDQELLHNYLKNERENFYRNIGGVFLKTWLNRLTLFVFEKKKCCSQYGQFLP